MELRSYRSDDDWYTPQYKQENNDKWHSFTLANLGASQSAIHKIAIKLGKGNGGFYNDKIYHRVNPNDYSDTDVELVFESEIKCFAFLGAAKYHWGKREKEFKI